MNKYPCFLLFSLSLLLACSQRVPSKGNSSLFDFHPEKSSFISLRNEQDIPNKGGHIQGVQLYQKGDESYYFFTGSSANQSYLAIADVETQKVISVQKLLDDPYRHAGGFQIIDDLLFVGIEDNVEKEKSWVLGYRILDPAKGELALLTKIKREGLYKKATAGSVAATKTKHHLWICVGNWDNHDLDVYQLALDQLGNSETIPELRFSINSEKLNRSNWVEKSWFSYQNINFFWNNESLFLAAMAEERLGGKQLLDIFSCDVEKDELGLKKVFHQKFPKKGEAGFRWGGGVYVDETAKLKLMACGEQILNEIEVRIWE